MKFNPNQRYTRWSIRRLSVGVASVVVASGFFVLVGQPSSVRADVVNPTPAQVVPDATSVSEKSDLPVELLKEAVDTALPSEKAASTPKASLDATGSPEKVNVADKDQVVAPKEEVQAKPESKKQTEDALKPATNTAPTVSGQDREANEAQPATTPAEVQKGVADNTKDTVDVPATYFDKANFPGPFTAGVNQVIPYEFFAGDGMLTRLILKASDKASQHAVTSEEFIWNNLVDTSCKWSWEISFVKVASWNIYCVFGVVGHTLLHFSWSSRWLRFTSFTVLSRNCRLRTFHRFNCIFCLFLRVRLCLHFFFWRYFRLFSSCVRFF